MTEDSTLAVLEETTNGYNQENNSSPKAQEFEVEKILSRKTVEDGEHQYEVQWKDGDITFEPISNLGGASDALKVFLLANYPEDPLVKVLSNLAESDYENDENVDTDGAVDKNLNFLAKWHQKTTRGSTQYWLRKGESNTDDLSLLKRLNNEGETEENEITEIFEKSKQAEVSPVLFSEGEETPGGGVHGSARIRKRYTVMEQTVKMYPHEELEEKERHERRTMELWREILGGVFLFGLTIALLRFIYVYVYPMRKKMFP